MGTSHENQYTFLIICHSVFLRMKNVSDENCRENQNTHFMLYNFFFLTIVSLWGNVENYCRARQATGDNILCALHAGNQSPQTHSQNM
jgi:hypothetical protein